MSDNRGRGANRGRGGPGRGGPPRGGSPSSSGRATPQYDNRGRGGPPRGHDQRGHGYGDRGDRGARGGGGDRGRGQYGGPVIFREGVTPTIPPRLSDASHKELVQRFQRLEVRPERPLRPGYGTSGIPITLRANFHNISHKGPVYDYTISISPDTDIKRIKGRIFELLELSPIVKPHLAYIAHDRSQRLVSARQLPQPLDINIPFYDDGDSGPKPGATVYTLSVKLDRILDSQELQRYNNGEVDMRDYDPLPIISALNLVLQQQAGRVAVRVGKTERKSSQQPKYFFPTQERKRLGPGIMAVQGFYASVRPAYKQLLVNVNVCYAAFVEPGNLADALLAFNRNSRGGMPTLPKNLVKSIKIKTRHLGHTKTIRAILTTSARKTPVDIPDMGGRITVETYFKRKYPNIKLKYPDELPVVDIGSANRQVYVPAELCDIIASVYRGKLSDTETAEMIKYACNIPKVNAEAIVNTGFPKLGFLPLENPAKGFNITIDPEMVNIPARELGPPGLSYRAGNARPSNGSWNIMNVKFQRGAVASSEWWVLVVIDSGRHNPTFNGPDDPRLGGLVDGFANKLRSSGMNIPGGRPSLLPPANLNRVQGDDAARTRSIDTIRSILKQELQKKSQQKPSFVLVLLENRDNFIYPGIKRIGDVELGIHTIHMQLKKALNEPKKQDQYLSNIALKVNTKLGGINHKLDDNAMKWLTKQKTMMVGIDVTHPGPGSREGTPSIAAVVASVDDSFVQFPASLRLQKKSKKEMLDELRDMLVERLLVYEKKNRRLPDRIIVFRDGVSEGQFDTVLEEELAQILEAFKKMSTGSRGKYRPKLAIIICGKRHHARFYPTDSQYADRNGNTRPGTVVDKGVTDVFNFDFYLQAHAGLQGTVKATHYTVVYDECSFGADEIQKGTHDVSYLYARATKAVSLIPPAYYADLACERGRCYLNDFLVDDQSTSVGRGRHDRDEEAARVFEAAKRSWGEGLHPDMRETMFYI